MKKAFTVIVYIFAIIGFMLVAGYGAMRLGLTKTKGVVDNQHDYFQEEIADQISTSTEAWIHSEEWSILKEAILKDKAAITKAAALAHIDERILVTPLAVEQLRLFNSEREIFKKVFAPLKMLGNQSQFSWGVLGIKQETAQHIEANLKDSTSPWYLGKEYSHLLDVTTSDIDTERFIRLTDEHDRYYSYLYGALLMKQLEIQWKNAGLPIDKKPEIIATLFNIGFENSKPNAYPQSGGAEIKIGETNYSFGSLAKSFYDSGELSQFK